MFDIELILGEHLFEKAADEKVRKYIEEHKDIYRLCPKCGLILDVKPTDTAVTCEICGYFKCLKCGQNHTTIHNTCHINDDS